MDTKIKWIITLMGFCVVIISSSCGKLRFDCAKTVYTFQIGVKAYPDRDSIRIGDTIWLEINAPTKLNDLQSGNVIDYSGAANFGNVVALLRFLPGNQSRGAINDFNLLAVKGIKVNSIDPITTQEVLFAEESGFYKFSMAVIPKDTGRYVLTIGNAANVYRKNDKCTKASFTIDFQSTNQHFYFLQLWRPDLILDEKGKKKVYYFKVY